MGHDRTTRWKQRFANFEKAFLFFERATQQDEYNPIEVGGLVQAFECAFELGWKTVKDYLEAQGVETNYPREVIQEAYRSRLIEDGHTWIHMLEKRNELSHTYNEGVARMAVLTIKERYTPALAQVYHLLKSKNYE